MECKTEEQNEMKKISVGICDDNSNKWMHSAKKNFSPLSSILKMMENIQSELLQAQIDLQDGQHQIQKIETIFQFEYKSFNVSNLLKSIQINKNNDLENDKVTELKNEISVIQNDNINIKKHLESVICSNSQLHNGIILVENELKIKDQLIESVKNENKKRLSEKKVLESNIIKINSQLNSMKNEFKEKLTSYKNEFNTRELSDPKYQIIQKDLQKQINEAKMITLNQDKTILNYKETIKNLEMQMEDTKRSVQNGIQSYEKKVKIIIEEIKKQKQFFEDENHKLADEFEINKKDLHESHERCELLSLKLLNKEDEIFQLKSKLVEKNQFEEREKLFKRELDENITQIRKYKAQIINLNSEKESYYNKICEQDNAIGKLIDEIRSLHIKIKLVKNQVFEGQANNDSTYTSTAERPNQSTPISQSTTGDLNDHSQSLVHYMHDHPTDDNGDNNCENNEEININSEYDSMEDNTIKKLASLLKGQTECTKNYLNACGMEENCNLKDQNNAFAIDEFSKYLEEQLQLIKIANERNVISIKRELTIK